MLGDAWAYFRDPIGIDESYVKMIMELNGHLLAPGVVVAYVISKTASSLLEPNSKDIGEDK